MKNHKYSIHAFAWVLVLLLIGCSSPQAPSAKGAQPQPSQLQDQKGGFMKALSDSWTSVKNFIVPATRLEKIWIVSTSTMNKGQAVILDFVFLADEELIDWLAGLSEKEWFDNKEDYIKQYYGKMKVKTFEPVAGQEIGNVNVTKLSKEYSAGVVIFARYNNGKKNVAVVSNMKRIVVKLSEESFEVAELPAK